MEARSKTASDAKSNYIILKNITHDKLCWKLYENQSSYKESTEMAHLAEVNI